MRKDQINAIYSEIRRLARELPSGQRDAIVNKVNKVQLFQDRGRKDETVDPAEETAIHGTQRQIILQWMLDGHTITSKEAFEKFGITRLSAVIFDIEKLYGKAPSRRFISAPTRYGKNVRVCEYWMDIDS